VRITYDGESNAAYVYLVEVGAGEVAQSVVFDGVDTGDFVFDFNRERRLVGIEILGASAVLPREVLDSAERIG
jgi:uncharacterized protein YuzE